MKLVKITNTWYQVWDCCHIPFISSCGVMIVSTTKGQKEMW